MDLSFHEVMNLIEKEQEKHSKNISGDSAQADKRYSRNAFFAMRDFEKTVRKYCAKKYS